MPDLTNPLKSEWKNGGVDYLAFVVMFPSTIRLTLILYLSSVYCTSTRERYACIAYSKRVIRLRRHWHWTYTSQPAVINVVDLIKSPEVVLTEEGNRDARPVLLVFDRSILVVGFMFGSGFSSRRNCLYYLRELPVR